MKRTLLRLLLSIAGILMLAACAVKTDEPPALIVENPIMPQTPTPASGCSVKFSQVEPTLAPSSASFIPPVSAADFSIGPADASVTMVEYCDFQSQGCAGMAGVVSELLKNHADLRFVFRPMPLIGILDKSDKAVLAALAADEQGQFWGMYDLLFTKYNQWSGLSPVQFDAWVIENAPAAGIDADQLAAAAPARFTALSR